MLGLIWPDSGWVKVGHRTVFGCPGITHTCLDPYPSLQARPPELTPSLPAHSHLLFPLPHSLTSSTWHLRLGEAGSCLSSHHSPVRGKLTFWRCCLGPQPLVSACLFPQQGTLPALLARGPLPQHGSGLQEAFSEQHRLGQGHLLSLRPSVLSVCAPTVPVPVI